MPNRVDGQVARPEVARPETPRADRAAQPADAPRAEAANTDRVEISAAARQVQSSRPAPAQPERGAAADAPSARPENANLQANTANQASQLREQQEQTRAANTETEPGETGNLVGVTG